MTLSFPLVLGGWSKGAADRGGDADGHAGLKSLLQILDPVGAVESFQLWLRALEGLKDIYKVGLNEMQYLILLIKKMMIRYLWNGFVWVKVIYPLQGVDVKVSYGHLQAFVISNITGFNIIKD